MLALACPTEPRDGRALPLYCCLMEVGRSALVDYHTEYLLLYAHGIDFLTGRDLCGQG